MALDRRDSSDLPGQGSFLLKLNFLTKVLANKSKNHGIDSILKSLKKKDTHVDRAVWVSGMGRHLVEEGTSCCYS